jgi:hypothetical protein
VTVFNNVSCCFPFLSFVVARARLVCLLLWFPTRLNRRLSMPPSVPPSWQQGEEKEEDRTGTVHRKPDTLHHGASHGREHTDRQAAPAHRHCTPACSPHLQLRLACPLLFAAIPTCVHRAYLHLSLYILGVCCVRCCFRSSSCRCCVLMLLYFLLPAVASAAAPAAAVPSVVCCRRGAAPSDGAGSVNCSCCCLSLV